MVNQMLCVKTITWRTLLNSMSLPTTVKTPVVEARHRVVEGLFRQQDHSPLDQELGAAAVAGAVAHGALTDDDCCRTLNSFCSQSDVLHPRSLMSIMALPFGRPPFRSLFASTQLPGGK